MSKSQKTIAALATISLAVFLTWWFYWPVHQTKTQVKRALNDPDSAIFSNVVFHRATGGACGFVNAKNRMGGYVGNTHFSVTKSGEVRFDPKADAKSGTATENQEAMKTEIVYLEFALSNCPENSNNK